MSIESTNDTIFLQLNELNFELLRKYIEGGLRLPSFEKILSWKGVTLASETRYELLEPWIQWTSINTGKAYEEHRVFRLGDVKNTELRTFYNDLEERGKTIGVVSCMNLSNSLEKPSFFIPDPWTETETDGSFMSNLVSTAVREFVNNNASGKIPFAAKLKIIFAILYFLRPLQIYKLITLLAEAKRKKWYKALAFDYFLSVVYQKLLRKYRPNFSSLFLNGCAHVQHHYMLSSKYLIQQGTNLATDWHVGGDNDPVRDMLIEYDAILSELLNEKNILIATALTQQPCTDPTHYYRLVSHEQFLDKLSLKFTKVLPRMSRDFEVLFESDIDRDSTASVLSRLRDSSGELLFGTIDKRSKSLFITLDYSQKIGSNFTVYDETDSVVIDNFEKDIALVAIKNGIHSAKNFFFVSENLPDPSSLSGLHCKEIHSYINSFC